MNNLEIFVEDTHDQPGTQVPDFYPFARSKLWIMLMEGVTPAQHKIVDFIVAHINEQTGRLDAFPSIATIGSVVGKKERSIQYDVNALIERGVLEVVPMYEVIATGERTTEPETPDGKKNRQTSNTYTVVMTPPGGMSYPGPISLAEFYDERRKNASRGKYKGLISKRIADAERRQKRVRSARQPHPQQGRVHLRAPSLELATSANPQEKGGASACTPPVHPSAPPPVHADAPKEDQRDLDQVESSIRPSVTRERSVSDQAPTDERTNHLARKTTKTKALKPATLDAATALLAEPDILAPLRRHVDVRESQLAQLAVVIGQALVDHEIDRVRGYLTMKIQEARTVKYLIGAFGADYVGDLRSANPIEHPDVRRTRPVHEIWPAVSELAAPPACPACLAEAPRAATSVRHRIARDGNGELLRNDDGRVIPCPACHPAALFADPVSV